MNVIFETQSEEQILTCFSVLSGFHSTFIVIIAAIAAIAVIVLVIGAFLKKKKISKSHISPLFISPVCLKTLLHLITLKATLYGDKYLLFLFGHHCHKNKSQLSVSIYQMKSNVKYSVMSWSKTAVQSLKL